MELFNTLSERFRPKRTDVVGLDISDTGTKAVRLKRSGSSVTLLAAEILESPTVAALADGDPAPMDLPRTLRARFVSLCMSGHDAVIKLLTFPGHFDQSVESQISEYMGLENPEQYRLGYKLISSGRGESRVLAVAIPDGHAHAACMLFPSGLPAPCSLEVSGLASLSAFLHSPAAANTEDAVGVVDFGARSSTVAFLSKGALALVRKLDVGSEHIITRVREALGVEAQVARDILVDGSFDVSQSVSEVLAPFVKQITVSRDFVERRENCRVTRVYACGGAARTPGWIREVQNALGVEIGPWDPFEGITVQPDGMSEAVKAQTGRLTGALGAALATLEEE